MSVIHSNERDQRWHTWRASEDRLLRREAGLKHSLEAIAARHRRTEEAIRSRMKKLGLHDHPELVAEREARVDLLSRRVPRSLDELPGETVGVEQTVAEQQDAAAKWYLDRHRVAAASRKSAGPMRRPVGKVRAAS